MIRTVRCLLALIRPPFRCSTVPLQARTRNGTTTATLRVIYPATNLGPGRATQQGVIRPRRSSGGVWRPSTASNAGWGLNKRCEEPLSGSACAALDWHYAEQLALAALQEGDLQEGDLSDAERDAWRERRDAARRGIALRA